MRLRCASCTEQLYGAALSGSAAYSSSAQGSVVQVSEQCTLSRDDDDCDKLKALEFFAPRHAQANLALGFGCLMMRFCYVPYRDFCFSNLYWSQIIFGGGTFDACCLRMQQHC